VRESQIRNNTQAKYIATHMLYNLSKPLGCKNNPLRIMKEKYKKSMEKLLLNI